MRREDYLPIVRSMIKMSAALNYHDELESTKYNKFKLKKSLKNWSETFSVLSSGMMKAFVEDGEAAFQDAYEQFVNFKSDVKLKDDEVTCLVLFYCKLKSAVNDLEETDIHVGGMLKFALEKTTNDVLSNIEKQYAEILKVKDSDGNGISAIISDYDELGKYMFTNVTENEESK